MRRERERRGVQYKSLNDQNRFRDYEWWLPNLAMRFEDAVTTMRRVQKVGWDKACKVK